MYENINVKNNANFPYILKLVLPTSSHHVILWNVCTQVNRFFPVYIFFLKKAAGSSISTKHTFHLTKIGMDNSY
jgi:hypothetical protein